MLIHPSLPHTICVCVCVCVYVFPPILLQVVAPMAKVDKCRRFGANVVITGQHIGEAKEYAQSNPDYNGMCVFVFN